jgi:hypothetical protein
MHWLLRHSRRASLGAALLALAGLIVVPGHAAPSGSVNLTGEWTGYWESETTGHTGPMRARFDRVDACHYDVLFCGRFCKVLPFLYATQLNVTGHGGGCVYLGGSHRLGPLFGTFRYSAWGSHTRFVASYSADNDRGRFVLTRKCD